MCKEISLRKAWILQTLWPWSSWFWICNMKWSTATAFWWPLTCFLQVIVVKVMRKLRDAIYFSAQKVFLILYSAVHFISRWNYVCIKGMYLINVVSKLKTSLEKITEFPGLTRVLLFMFSYISLDSFYFKASCHNLMFHSLHCWNMRVFWHQSTWNICLNKCSIGACQLWPVAFSYSSCWMYLEGWHSAGSEVNFGISNNASTSKLVPHHVCEGKMTFLSKLRQLAWLWDQYNYEDSVCTWVMKDTAKA